MRQASINTFASIYFLSPRLPTSFFDDTSKHLIEPRTERKPTIALQRC